MKKGIYALRMFLVAMIAAVTTTWCYHRFVPKPQGTVQQDSVLVDTVSVPTAMPLFYSAEDVLQFHDMEIERQFVDSVFFSIPIETLYQIAQVVTTRLCTGATEKEIVIEYLRNYHNVYQYLKTDDPPVNNTTELQELKSLSTDTIYDKNDSVK